MKGQPVKILLWCLATLIIAGIAHLTSILILPFVAPNDTFARLARFPDLNGMVLLPKPGSHQDPIPFRDPALASAICRYDLDQGGLRVEASVEDAAFLAISFHSPKGIPFYALTNRSGDQGRIALILLTAEQLEKVEAADNEDEPVREIRVRAPDRQGFVEFDVLPRIGGYAAARQILTSATCAPALVPP